MPCNIKCRIYWCLFTAGIIMLSGCTTTQSSKFYLLQTGVADIGKAQLTENNNTMVLGVGPVELPDYLNRPQIVTRVSGSEFHLSEFNRWAESLEKNFSRVLAENLSTILSTDNVLIYPFERSKEIERQVKVNILQLDGQPSGNVVLKVHWSLMGNDGKDLLLVKKSSFSGDAGKGYSGMVAGMNRLVSDFSQEVAREIKSRDNE